MIISHKHKFIFLKTNKTAGTSIEIGLSKFCGPNDVITPISSEDERVRKELGYPGPRNYLSPIWAYRTRDLINFFAKKSNRKLKRKYYNHIPADKVRTRVGEQVWDNYYKFCFERNPWDRLVSLYYWRRRKNPKMTLNEFIDSGLPLVLKNKGINIYTINEKVAVDRVCLYENLIDELETIQLRIGIPEKIILPKTKSKFRKSKEDYRNVFNAEQRDRIAEIFHDEIKLFGYKF